MANRLRIAVLTHEFDDFENDGFLLGAVCSEWRRANMDVVVVRGLPEIPPVADVAVLHTNMTLVDPAYVELARQYPVAINGASTDISKRLVSQQIVTNPDDSSGPVIVKTNANFGGRPEVLQAMRRGQKQGSLEQATWGKVQSLANYRVFRSAREVPAPVWDNPHLVVDRFTPEQNSAGEFVLRIWIFLGDHSLHYCAISKQPIIKGSNTIRRDPLDRDAVPEEIRERRVELGFDYGKFDYVQVGGQARLLDANKTPGLRDRDRSNTDYDEPFRHLSEGLQHFLADKPSTAGEKVNPA
jgi:hypothetical protein